MSIRNDRLRHQLIRQAFTLIELLVVIGIIGAIAWPAFLDYRTEARMREGLALVRMAQAAVELTSPTTMIQSGFSANATFS